MEYKNKIFLRGIIGFVHNRLMSVATNRMYRNVDNENTIETDWHTVDFSKAVLQGSPEKGSKVEVEGYLRQQRYTSSDGVERHICTVVASKVIVLDTKENLTYENQMPVKNNQ